MIEHSAGSGKTNTIAWLAHILASLHDTNDQNVFSNIIVITDRIIVDQQLQDAVKGIDHKTGQLKVMDEKCHSDDLAAALRGNTKIIVTTVHKFFYIIENSLLSSLKEMTTRAEKITRWRMNASIGIYIVTISGISAGKRLTLISHSVARLDSRTATKQPATRNGWRNRLVV